MSRDVVLEVRALTAGYGAAAVLDGVSLQVRRGQLVSLIGPNGAGKSTLLNVLAGLHPGRSGSARYLGSDVLSRETEDLVRAGLVLVPERRDLFGSMSVEDNLALGGFARRADGVARLHSHREEVYALFPRLRERRAQLAQTLSGGERQMLALGRALMARPELLMLDEPSLGLAPLVVRDIMDMIRRLCDRGITVLLVEQNARMALEISDFGYVIESGRIGTHGAAGALRGDPRVAATYLGGTVQEGERADSPERVPSD